jgi:hypothetical protein
LTILVDEKELPVMGSTSLGPVDVNLHSHPGRHGIGADQAPPASEDVELAVGDLG